MAKFEARKNDLYIDGNKVIKGYESFSGWYFFATKIVQKQDTLLDGKVYKDDTIYYGFVQGLEEEWVDFSKAELESLKPKVWEIKKQDLPYAGRYNQLLAMSQYRNRLHPG